MDVLEKVDRYQQALNEMHPFEGHMLSQIHDHYRISLTWSSNALEGNALTEIETKVLLEDGLTAGGKPLRDSYEALGHARAYDHMFTLLHAHAITEQDIFTMHWLFYSQIDEKNAGVYRTEPVFITGSKYPVAKLASIQSEMDTLLAWCRNKRDELHPVEFAAQLHKRFVFIHPFIDGNGRIARLLMNVALIQDGYMLAVTPPVLRHEYVTLLEKAHRDDHDFTVFIGERVLETQKNIMRLLQIPIPRLEQAPPDRKAPDMEL